MLRLREDILYFELYHSAVPALIEQLAQDIKEKNTSKIRPQVDPAPKLWADGQHNDAPWLQWQIDHCPDCGTIHIPAGTYVSETKDQK